MKASFPLAVLFVFAWELSGVAQVLTWTGSASNDWLTAGNWSGTGAPPDANTDTAIFNSVATNASPNVSTATTIKDLQFVSGAGSYSFSGSQLTMTGGTYFIDNSSGTAQTFANTVALGGGTGTASIRVTAGSTLTFDTFLGNSESTTRRSVNFSGGGTVNLNGATSRINQLMASSGTVVNFNSSTTSAANNYWASGGRINLLKTTGSSGISLTLNTDGSEIYLSTAGLSVGAQSINFRTYDNSTVTFGADIAGSGTATATGTVSYSTNGAVANSVFRLYAGTDDTLILSGVQQDSNAAGTGTHVDIVGGGVVRFSGTGANTSTTPILVSAGRLELAKTAGVNAIGGGSVNIASGGSVRLVNANQIADTVTMTLTGGTFQANGQNETLGALTVGAAGGTIDLASTSNISFASLSSISGTLVITGWASGVSSIYFADVSGWDAAALAKVQFSGYEGGAELVGNYLAPVPEPGTVAFLALGLVVMGAKLWRRRPVAGVAAAVCLASICGAQAAEKLPVAGASTTVTTGAALTEGLKTAVTVADATALGGEYAKNPGKYQPMARAALPAQGDTLVVWVHYRNAALQMKARVDGKWAEFPWDWKKSAEKFTWKRVGEFPRAELGEGIIFITPTTTPEDGGIDAIVITADATWQPPQ